MARFHFCEFGTLDTTLEINDVSPEETEATFRAGLDSFFAELREDDNAAGPKMVDKICCPKPIPPWASDILRELMPQCYGR